MDLYGPNPEYFSLYEDGVSYLRILKESAKSGIPPRSKLQSAVEFEVWRFSQQQEMSKRVGKVEDALPSFLAERLGQFWFEPSSEWSWDPIQHSLYALGLLLAIPNILRAVAARQEIGLIEAKHVQVWLVDWITWICPYVCPG